MEAAEQMTGGLESKAGVALMLLLGGATAQAVDAREVLMDPVLRILCFGGAIGGGFMALAFFPRASELKNSLRAEAARWAACSIFGGTFAPFVVENYLPTHGLAVTASSVLATSSFLGLFAWAIVQGVQSLVRRKLDKEGKDGS